MKRWDWKQSLPWLLGITVASVFVLWPLFRPGFFVSDDGGWMIIRLSAFFQSFRDGQFPVRFLGRLNHNYGYPVANFLYPGFLYLGSVIHAVGISYIDTVKVILGGSLLASGFMSFVWLSVQFSLLASFMGAMGVVFAPYLVFDLYHRGSVGELFAVAVFTTLLAAVERFPWAVPALVGLLIMSHNTLALMFLGFFVLYLLLQKKISLFPSLCLGVALAAFFWIPALVEQRYVWFPRVQVSDPFSYFLSAPTYWLVGIVPLLMLLLSFVGEKKKFPARNLFFFTFVCAVLLSLPASSVFWHIGLLAKIVQFPYRFLSLAVVAGSWIVAYGLSSLRRFRPVVLVVIVALWIIPLASFVRMIDPQHYPDDFYATNEATTTVLNEYMPRWVSRPPQERKGTKLEFFSGKGTISYQKVTSLEVKAAIHADEQSMIQVNTVYYPGWGMQLDGAPIKFAYNNPQGVMRVDVPHGDHVLAIEFRETPLRFGADMLSLIAFGLFISSLVFGQALEKRP